MDGRVFRKWWLSGLLMAGAVGCDRQSIQAPWDDPPPAQPVTGIPMTTAKKPFFGSSTPTPTTPVPVEPVAEGPPKPETLVALADVQVESALNADNPPANRDELLDRARDGYYKALEHDPHCGAAMISLGRYYTRLGERAKALEWYNKYLDENRNDKEIAHEVALAHAQWQDWAGAVAWCDVALSIDPENLTTRKTKAFCLARGGQWQEGFDLMREMMPEPQARYLMARVLEHQKHLPESREQLVLALQADPSFAEARAFLTELDMVITGRTPPNYNPNAALQQAGYQDQPYQQYQP